MMWSNALSAKPYTFRNYSTADGLSHTMINCMIQDRLGFIWIGTSDGLNRFDGYAFKKHYNKKNDSLTLKDNNINALVEDKSGRIWLATGTGFHYYIPETEVFHKVHFTNGTNNRLSEDVCIDDEGTVWAVENSNLLACMNSRGDMSGKFIRLDSLLGYTRPMFSKKLVSAGGFIWIFSNAGVIRFDPQTFQAQIIASEYQFNSPRVIRKGKPGELFVVDWNKGVFLLSMSTLEIQPYRQQQILRATKNKMGITDILYDDSTVWILSYPGLCKISESGDLAFFNTDSGFGRDYDKIVFFSSMRDKQGNLWFGTQDEGIFAVSSKKEVFRHYSVASTENTPLPASKFIVNADDVIFCNPFGTYLCRKQSAAGNCPHTVVTTNMTVALSTYSDTEYVLFGKNKVTAYNKSTRQMRSIYETTDIQNGMVDSRGILWMTHWEYGMEGYHPATKKRYQIDVEKRDKSANVVFCMLEDSDGSLWLGTFGSGLQHVQNPDSPQPIITKYAHSEDPNSLNNDFVTTLYDDGLGTLWVGTNGGGLHRLNKADGRMTAYTTDDGLRSNVIQSIVSDSMGNVWFASNVITKFDLLKNTFTHYDMSDGVSSKYFTLQAQKSADGTLYFGDDRGILHFHPSQIISKGLAPAPVFTGVRLLGQPIRTREAIQGTVPFPSSVSYTDSVKLPYYLNSISLEFASIQFDNSDNINYSYMLSGIDKQWVHASSSERLATYAGLPQGEYYFQVRAANEQNKWGPVRTLHITITPPWWRTLWFRVSAILLFATILALYIYDLVRRNQTLEKTVLKRTRELQEANKTLREERLVIEMKNKHLGDVLQSKEKLMNIIAHDFKSPLTGILGVSELLQREGEKIKHAKIVKYISTITSSANSLVNQMIALLDWSLNEDENLQANPIEINAEVLVNDAVDLVRTNADAKNISIELVNTCTKNTLVDPRMASMIFRNIFSNAIKFTPNNGSITVFIKETPQNVEITFTDSGVGMPQHIIDQLLAEESAVQPRPGTANEIGTGFGLRMIRKFLDKNNGKLSISSSDGSGSAFCVTLPKGERDIAKMNTAKSVAAPDMDADHTDSRFQHSVLIVDDEEATNLTLFEALSPHYHVIRAYNAQDGFNYACQMVPDVIVSDINMSGMSGIDMCKHLKKNKKTFHIPIILISSYADKDTMDSAFNAGANDYIEKPLNTFHLMKKVESLLVLKQKINEKTRNEIASEVFPEIPATYENEILIKINQFVEDNISNEKLNTNIVAAELGISRAQLWRIYKKETGYSLGDYIKERKIQKASAMLLTGKYRISEIGFELGFADARYFSKWFMKERGMTPTQFIEKMGNAK